MLIEFLLFMLIAVVVVANIIVFFVYLRLVSLRNALIPFNGEFKIKHLFLVFVLPALIFGSLLAILTVGLAILIEYIQRSLTSGFLNKPLFKKRKNIESAVQWYYIDEYQIHKVKMLKEDYYCTIQFSSGETREVPHQLVTYVKENAEMMVKGK